MSEIIHLHADPHLETQMLLPWYANGTLEGEELATVETHLAACPQCRDELAGERALGREIAALPAEAPPGWASLKARAEAGARRDRPAATTSARSTARPSRRPVFGRRVTLGWALAAQAAMVVVGVGAVVLAAPRLQPRSNPQVQPAYHVLGAAPGAVDGNVLVMFRPTTSEQELRATLVTNDARLVDGPTATGGYVLHVPAPDRDAVLARLRSGSDVIMAEAIDGDLRP